MLTRVRKLKQTVAAWPHVSVRPHQFSADEFRFDNAEVGHVHAWGTADIPFPRAIRDALLEEHLAEEHRWVPNSGWTTFQIHSDKDLEHALWLMRLSYLRYALKTEVHPSHLLREEVERLHLNPRLASLLAQFVPSRTKTG
jgi:hypothetical protein